MRFWAHSKEGESQDSWQPLLDHLLGVAEKARDFAAVFGAGDIAWILGLCHDLGKYSKEFQERLKGSKIRVDHATPGARIVGSTYGPLGLLMAYAIAGHHGGMPDGGNDLEEVSLTYRLKRKDVCDFSAYKSEVSLPSTVPNVTLSPTTSWLGFSIAFFVRMLFSCLVDSDFLDTEAFMEPVKGTMRGGTEPLADLEQKLADYLNGLMAGARSTLVNAKRAQVLSDCLDAAELPPGLFSLTVPTGGGKTLSSLSFALKHARLHGLRRIIYTIPYTSIIDQNAQVFRRAVGNDPVLEHHSNLIRTVDTPNQESATRLELAEENWDAPLIVSTNVQFFESLFSHKPSRCRKLHNIAKSVIILDEAQMLPLDLLRPCVAALYELVRNYGATVVLCSATQPALDSLFPQDMRPVEIIKDPPGLYKALQRVDVSYKGVLSDNALAQELRDKTQALCIVNTRAHARQVFECLGKGEGHYHLSAAMCPAHRKARLHEIKTRLESGAVCRVVSTQLVEAGVDVDFGVVLRAVAGIDSIAQAAGRCNREGKLDRGQVFVFVPEGNEGLSHVWFKRTAAVAAPILENTDDPLALDKVRQYFQELYFYEGGFQGASGLDAHGLMQEFERGARAFNFPFRKVSETFKIIGDDTVGVVIPYDDNCQRILDQIRFGGMSREAGRLIQQFSVSVRYWEYKKMMEEGVLEDIGGVSVLGNATLYHPDYGLTPPASSRGSEAWIV